MQRVVSCAQVAVDFGRCVCPQQMCAIQLSCQDMTPFRRENCFPNITTLPMYQSTTAVQFRDEIFSISFRIQLSISLCNYHFYSLFVSGGAVSSEFNILCISGVNEFWQLCQINLRFSDISASTMSKHLFCVSSILKCCMFTFGWNVPIGNSKDASGKVRWGNCLNKMNLRPRKLE